MRQESSNFINKVGRRFGWHVNPLFEAEVKKNAIISHIDRGNSKFFKLSLVGQRRLLKQIFGSSLYSGRRSPLARTQSRK